MNTCSIPGCDRAHYGRTWCSLHYKRWAAHGDPTRTSKPRLATAHDHFRHYMPGSPPDEGCWLWAGPVSYMYGTFAHKGVSYRAHRIAYEMFIGPVPDNAVVMHKCDVPSCVNPVHLTTGTCADNNQDKAMKGRSRGGGAPKLTEDAVREIRRRLSERSDTQRALAEEHGVTVGAIEAIAAHRTWRNV